MARPLLRSLLLGLLAALTFLVLHGSQRLENRSGLLSKDVHARDVLVFAQDDYSRNHSSALSKRALSYADAVAKGCRNLNFMQGQLSIRQSVFTTAAALPDNGWDEGQVRVFPSDLSPAFTGLGFSTSTADNMQITSEQNVAGNTAMAYGTQGQPDYVAAGQHYEDTYGYYQNLYNTRNGVIVGLQNFSPTYQSGPNAEQPPLNKYSDVTWLLWQSYNAGTKTSANNLNYYFRYHIVESDSVSVINAILAMTTPATTLSPWPGTVYQMNTDIGKALLGTPNGNGVAFFLAQHQAQLGRKTVSQVNLFGIDNPAYNPSNPDYGPKVYPNFAFKIVPYTA